jgi:hypothetical protein
MRGNEATRTNPSIPRWRAAFATFAAASLVAVIFPGATAGATPAEASTGLKRPLEVTMKVSGWCDNTGSDINIVGDLSLGALGMKITLSNNVKGTHAVPLNTAIDMTVLSAADHLSVVKQPALGGVGGNPWAIFQLEDTEGNVLTNEAGNPLTYVLGRCVTGNKGANNQWSANLAEQLGLDGGIDSFIRALNCSQKGSSLNVKAAGFNEGVNGRVILANQINKAPGEPGVHYAEVVADALVNILGATPHKKGWWDKDADIHGPGGNPLVFRQDDAETSGYDVTNNATWGAALGRCNKLT